jgi:hypothetical protein
LLTGTIACAAHVYDAINWNPISPILAAAGKLPQLKNSPVNYHRLGAIVMIIRNFTAGSIVVHPNTARGVRASLRQRAHMHHFRFL